MKTIIAILAVITAGSVARSAVQDGGCVETFCEGLTAGDGAEEGCACEEGRAAAGRTGEATGDRSAGDAGPRRDGRLPARPEQLLEST